MSSYRLREDINTL